MPKNDIERLVDRWLDDANFRAAMQQDPEATVRSSGIQLNAEEWATVRNVVMASSDEELRARVSKGLVRN